MYLGCLDRSLYRIVGKFDGGNFDEFTFGEEKFGEL